MADEERPALRWLVYPSGKDRFPFTLLVEHEPGSFLCYEVQEKWPGPGKSVFCLSRGTITEDRLPPDCKPVDSCAITVVRRYGRKLTVLLDRKNRKRSWFITVEKQSKRDPARTYEQTFWITQSSAAAHRGGAFLPARGKERDLAIVRDARERYGYRFPRQDVVRAVLPVGDYALRDTDGNILALVERKTRDQFLGDIATLEVLRARLLEMTGACRHKAFVIEATYADLVDPKRSRFYSGGFVADVIADLSASFPDVQFVFCTNRKFAAEWVERWFTRIARAEDLPTTTADHSE
jgi:hypothetical protein